MEKEKIKGSFQNTMLIANLLMSNGLALGRNVLEISEYSGGGNSLSRILAGHMKRSFLLSREFNPDEAKKYGIEGAKGQLFSPFGNVSISIEDCSANPSINSFDTVVVEGFSNDLLLLPGLKQDIFVGYSLDKKDKNLPELRKAYEMLYRILDFKTKNGYLKIGNQYGKSDREICLIVKKQ